MVRSNKQRLVAKKTVMMTRSRQSRESTIDNNAQATAASQAAASAETAPASSGMMTRSRQSRMSASGNNYGVPGPRINSHDEDAAPAPDSRSRAGLPPSSRRGGGGVVVAAAAAAAAVQPTVSVSRGGPWVRGQAMLPMGAWNEEFLRRQRPRRSGPARMSPAIERRNQNLDEGQNDDREQRREANRAARQQEGARRQAAAAARNEAELDAREAVRQSVQEHLRIQQRCANAGEARGGPAAAADGGVGGGIAILPDGAVHHFSEHNTYKVSINNRHNVGRRNIPIQDLPFIRLECLGHYFYNGGPVDGNLGSGAEEEPIVLDDGVDNDSDNDMDGEGHDNDE